MARSTLPQERIDDVAPSLWASKNALEGVSLAILRHNNAKGSNISVVEVVDTVKAASALFAWKYLQDKDEAINAASLSLIQRLVEG